MSADNWWYCPYCVQDARAAFDARTKEIEDLYGKLPADEWEALRAEHPREFVFYEQVERTLREDWEEGFEGSADPADPTTTNHYKAGCSKCGAQVESRVTVTLQRRS